MARGSIRGLRHPDMAGLSDYSARGILNHLVGKSAFPFPTAYMALCTAAPTDSGGGTEVLGGSYARALASGAAWVAASGSAPVRITNATSITFPAAAAAWGIITAWELWDAPNGGNLLFWDWMGAANWLPVSIAAGVGGSASILTAPAHGFNNGDSVILTDEFGGALPTTGIWAGLRTVANVTIDTFNLGSISANSGSGMVRKVVTQNVPSGFAPAFAAGVLTLSLA